MTPNSPNAERRSGVDRREKNATIFSRHRLMGKRTRPRREEDRQRSYRTDRHSSKTLVAILLIISLSILDAILTLYLISHGASEMNPIMNYFLDHGPLAFFGAKYLLTCAAAVLVLLNKNIFLFKTKMRVKILFALFLIPFILVIHWELYLILFVL
ncbi:MAG: hypothetical protein JW786_05880 [Desulfobacterales bacterium]|nr:hypothetical protein [Desulfobacterales bacterium]